jgi:RNA polymerase sigma-54 factor
VASSKYVQTDLASNPLKIFSEGRLKPKMEGIWKYQVEKWKKYWRDAIDEEERKPLPDEKLMEILKEKGYTIARRTVGYGNTESNLIFQ